MIWLFLASLFFLFRIKIQKNITLLGPFGFFIGYQIIYNIIPWLASILDLKLFSLSGETDLLAAQLLIGSFCNVAFGIVYFMAWRPTAAPVITASVYRINPQILFGLAYLPTLYMVQHYGWNNFGQVMQTGGTPTLLNSIASFMKLFLIACFIHCLSLFRFSRSNLTILGGMILLLFVDGARTNFMMIISLCLFFAYDGGRLRVSTKNVTGIGLVFVIFVLSRSLRLQNDFYQNILDTFLAEGIIGSYMNIQTIYILKYFPNISPTFGANYFIDPVISLTPLSSMINGSFDNWITRISPNLIETFAPVGGFYYTAEALASFGWSGPAFITTLYAIITVKLNNELTRNPNIYLLYLCTFGCLFSKTQFINCFKLFVVILICYYTIQFILTVNPSNTKHPKETP